MREIRLVRYLRKKRKKDKLEWFLVLTKINKLIFADKKYKWGRPQKSLILVTQVDGFFSKF